MKYLYYTLYRNLLKVKTNNTPAWSAMFLITLLEFINLTTLSLLLPKSVKVIYEPRSQVVLEATIITIILIFINYLLMIIETDRLIEKYKNETDIQKKRGNIILAIYSVISIFAVYFVGNNIS